MKITFCGAAGEVTGSCIYIETGKARFLVDCGLFQGGRYAREENTEPWFFNPAEINFVLLTHAHADHCGRLPKLYADGFRGKIYATSATHDLAELIMLDSAKIIKEESEKIGQAPLFSEKDVYGAVSLFSNLPYHQKTKIIPGVEINFLDAGHILGSASVECFVKDGKQDKKIVFSGDLGNPPAPVICDTEFASGADAVIIESTYGGRTHEPAQLREQKLKEIIMKSVGKGGVLMIPIFALERTQEVLYELNHLVETRQLPRLPIFLDSPLSIDALNVYRHYSSLYDAEAKERLGWGDDIFNFEGLTLCRQSYDSKKINTVKPPKLILAGSGMINGGRMIHHLKQYLEGKNNTLLFISYQAEGTLGRALLDGAKVVDIEGEKIKVQASVEAIGAYSSHADQSKLITWLGHINDPLPAKVFIDHGEDEQRVALGSAIKKKFKLEPTIINKNQTYEI